MNIYEVPNEKVFDTTLLGTKISLWTKFRLLFVKKQISNDFIHDNRENELWAKTTYKVLDDKYYIVDFKNYYVIKHKHCMNLKSKHYNRIMANPVEEGSDVND